MTDASKLTVFDSTSVEPVINSPFFVRVLEGDPTTKTWRLHGSADQGVVAGMWEATPGKWEIDYKVWEFCHVLSGICVIQLDGQEPVTLTAGSAFVIEPGAKGTWTVLETMRKHLVIRWPGA